MVELSKVDYRRDIIYTYLFFIECLPIYQTRSYLRQCL